MPGLPPGSHYVCVCLGGPVPSSFFQYFNTFFALVVPEGSELVVAWGSKVRWWMLQESVSGSVEKSRRQANKASQGLGSLLSALPPRCPFCPLGPTPLPIHEHMWITHNGTQLDSHLPCSNCPLSLSVVSLRWHASRCKVFSSRMCVSFLLPSFIF